MVQPLAALARTPPRTLHGRYLIQSTGLASGRQIETDALPNLRAVPAVSLIPATMPNVRFSIAVYVKGRAPSGAAEGQHYWARQGADERQTVQGSDCLGWHEVVPHGARASLRGRRYGRPMMG